ncbi:class I SAM-dependent methyltransferase [Salinispira pacifica]
MAIEPYLFHDYLETKISVDDRSLNAAVRSALLDRIELAADVGGAPAAAPFRVLDIGTGTGAMVRRLAGWISRMPPERRPPRVRIVGVDSEPGSLVEAERRFAPEAGAEGLEAKFIRGDLSRPGAGWAVPGNYDLITANAVLDLLPLDRAVGHLRSLLAPAGSLYATINYDGLTELIPGYEDERYEASLLAWYDRTMDRRRLPEMAEAGSQDDSPSGVAGGRKAVPAGAGGPAGRGAGMGGGSRTGRALAGAVLRAGFDLAAIGSSDWVIFPEAGRYPARDADFLRYILAMIHGEALRNRRLAGRRLEHWYRSRREAVDAGILLLIVHQIDLLALRR